MQSQVRFNRVPEKAPEKIPGSLGAKPSQVQPLVQSQVRFNRVPSLHLAKTVERVKVGCLSVGRVGAGQKLWAEVDWRMALKWFGRWLIVLGRWQLGKPDQWMAWKEWIGRRGYC